MDQNKSKNSKLMQRLRALIRAAFFAFGLTLAGSGSLLFAVDSITLKKRVSEAPVPAMSWVTSATKDGRRIITPPDWIPFTLIGIGGVTVLYAVALPKN